jgi:cellulose synthase/poly-beta-1,6-N-acetylglucosamine synthase-like glycosyltransferase
VTFVAVIFYLSIAVIIYTYIGFSLLLFLRGTLFPKPHKQDASYRPTISMIVAAYNEEDSIVAKIENIKAMDYPKDKVEFLIASDGSSDATNALVEANKNEQIRLLALERLGKAKALNAAIAVATGEVLVFSDANSMYSADALVHLAKHFADAQIGGVAGNQVYLKNKSSAENAGETSYWSIDRQLKIWESRGGNTISATGAIYAIRRSLFHEVMEGVTDDFYVSSNVISQGSRLVFEPEAIAYETVAKNQSKEFGRKVRIMTRGLNAVVQMRHLLNPFRYGFYSLQLFTHKVLRRLLFIPFILVFLCNIILATQGWFYQLLLIPQVLLYGMAFIGWLLLQQGRKLPRLIALPTYAVMVYVAAAQATWNVIIGKQIVRWSTERAVSS